MIVVVDLGIKERISFQFLNPWILICYSKSERIVRCCSVIKFPNSNPWWGVFLISPPPPSPNQLQVIIRYFCLVPLLEGLVLNMWEFIIYATSAEFWKLAETMKVFNLKQMQSSFLFYLPRFVVCGLSSVELGSFWNMTIFIQTFHIGVPLYPLCLPKTVCSAIFW